MRETNESDAWCYTNVKITQKLKFILVPKLLTANNVDCTILLIHGKST